MKHTAEELYNKLPSSWKEITVEMYLKLTANREELLLQKNDVLIDGFTFKVDDTFHYQDITNKKLAILLNISEDEIEELTFREIEVLASKLFFLNFYPVEDVSQKMNFKTVEDFKYGDYILLTQFNETYFENLPMILPVLMKPKKNEKGKTKKLTVQEVMQLDMETVHQCFFLHKIALQNLLRNMISLEKKRLMKFRIQEKFNKIFKPNYKVPQEPKQQQ